MKSLIFIFFGSIIWFCNAYCGKNNILRNSKFQLCSSKKIETISKNIVAIVSENSQSYLKNKPSMESVSWMEVMQHISERLQTESDPAINMIVTTPELIKNSIVPASDIVLIIGFEDIFSIF